MRISPEDGTGSPLEPERVGSGAVATVQEVQDAPPDRGTLIQDLIWQALQGTMPVARPLKSNEPRFFSAKHINMVFDAVQGPMTNSEICEKYEASPAHVSVVLNHPFAEILRAALLGQIADNLTDPLLRMRAYTHEMIDMKVQIARDPGTPKQLRNKIANDFLDRVGYGPRVKIDTDDGLKVPQLPEPVMARFAESLEGAARVADLKWDKFVQRGGAGVGEVQAASSATQAAEPVAQDTDAEGLPGGPTQTSSKERAA